MKRDEPAIARAFVNIPEWEECGQGRNRVCAPARRFFNETIETIKTIHSCFPPAK